ncbi:MAG: hypothetical protein ACJAYG_002051 [Oceanicoccus sp.]|jgi:uncharacterized protein (DUF1499 family)
MSEQHETTAASAGAKRIRNLALLLLILLPVSALGSRFGLWPFTAGMLIMVVSLLGSLIIQIINAIWLLRKPNADTKSALRLASLYALPPLVIIASIMRGGDGARAGIHNISTDLDTPPQFVAAVEQRGSDSNPLEYTAEVAAIQSEAFPTVSSINSTLSVEQALQQAEKVATELGWDIYALSAPEGRIEAVETTFWFGFKDDIVIRVKADDSGSQIDLRSVSRVGKGDMGANAKRILAFSEIFKQKTNSL